MLFMPCTLNFVLQHLRARIICAQVGCSDNVLPGLCDDNEGVEVAIYLVQVCKLLATVLFSHCHMSLTLDFHAWHKVGIYHSFMELVMAQNVN